MSSLQISLLGTFHIRSSDSQISHFHSNKVRGLLTYLAVESNRPHTRSLLASLFWPDVAADQALAHLRKAAHHLGRAIEVAALPVPLLLSDHWSMQLNPLADCQIDVVRFHMLITEVETHCGRSFSVCHSCAELLYEATALYSGEFIAGFTAMESLAFEEWILTWRQRLSHKFVEALARLAVYHEGYAEHRIAISFLRRWLEAEPWNEETHRWLIAVLARDGQRSAALHQFGLCQRAIVAEFQSQPSAQTIALYHAIQHRSANGSRVPRQRLADRDVPLLRLPQTLTLDRPV